MTVEGWNRRKTGLGAVLTLVVAVGALADPLHRPWLKVFGLVVAAVIGVASLALEVAKGRLEGKREGAERARRFMVAPVARIDPTQIGVDAAAPTALGQGVPDYVARDVDADLRTAVEAALNGGGDWLLVVAGPSKVGKSRTLFQALASCSKVEQLVLFAPANGNAVRSLLDPAQPMANKPRYAVLWLDDLELWLTEGVTVQTLREWHSIRPGWIVAATYGGKGSERVTATGELRTLADDVLQHATQIPLTATTESEIRALHGQLGEDELTLVRDHGLAAYLVAGPALKRKLTTTRHAAGEPECPEGVAVVRAAVDWARCGRIDPISKDTLQGLWPSFLPIGTARTPESFAAGLHWAMRPVAARIALVLEHDPGRYQAYDYVTRLVREDRATVAPRDAVWAVALDSATPEQAFAVGVSAYTHARLKGAEGQASLKDIDAASAYIHARLEDTEAAFGRAADSADPVLAAQALFSRGVILAQLDRPQEALDVWQQLIDTYRADPTPELRQQVAQARRDLLAIRATGPPSGKQPS